MKTKNLLGTDVTYTLFRQTNNRASLIGPLHTDSVKDQFTVTQRDPVPSKNEKGYRRTEAQYQVTIPVTEPLGVVPKVLRVEVSASIPVGTTEAEIEEAFARVGNLSLDSTLVHDIFVIGKRPV
nr:MAG: hypothetical protein 2 [Leviviridae sp.]